MSLDEGTIEFKDRTNPLEPQERELLKQLRRTSKFVFGFQPDKPIPRGTVNIWIGCAAKQAGLEKLRPHGLMLRHSKAFALAKQGKDAEVIADTLNYSSVKSALKYTEMFR